MIGTRIRKIESLTGTIKDELFDLHANFFTNCNRDVFLKDLSEKDCVILCEEGGKTRGFSTIKIHDERAFGDRVLFLFSGDTIVHPEYWSRNMLIPAFAAFLTRMMEQYRDARIYWYLISKGYRTYMFLPVLFKEFYPTPLCATAHYEKSLLDFISAKRFGEHYDP